MAANIPSCTLHAEAHIIVLVSQISECRDVFFIARTLYYSASNPQPNPFRYQPHPLAANMSVIRVPPLTLAQWPPEGAANRCGHPANLSGLCLGANPLTVAGY